MGASHLSVVAADASPTAADAVIDLVAADAEAGVSLRRAARHVVLPDREPSALRQMLARRDQRYTHAEVEEAVFEVALELLPESWAAARERLRVRVEAAEKTVPISGRGDAGRREGDSPVLPRSGKRAAADPKAPLTPEEAILYLLSDDTACLREVASLSLYPLVGDELRRVTLKLWCALRRRGRHYRGRYFSDHLAVVARDLFPHSKGAEWSVEWADAVACAAAKHVASQVPPGVQPVPSEDEERAFGEIRKAALAEDRGAYRRAVRSWVDAVLVPFEEDDSASG